MNNEDRYEEIINETFDKVRRLGRVKGGEYAAAGDRLDNFRRNAAECGISMETCWKVYAGKHWDAISTYVRDMQNGVLRERSEPIAGRVDDLIVYLILFKLMFEERFPQPDYGMKATDTGSDTPMAAMQEAPVPTEAEGSSYVEEASNWVTEVAERLFGSPSAYDAAADVNARDDRIRACGCRGCRQAVNVASAFNVRPSVAKDTLLMLGV